MVTKRNGENWAQWYERNRLNKIMYARAYYYAHAEELRERRRIAWRNKSWASMSIEKQREYQARQKAKKPHYARDYRRARKELVVQALGGRCAKCGYSRNPAGLNIHHKPGMKLKTVDWLNSHWREFLPKLVLLCGNCHQEEHHPH